MYHAIVYCTMVYSALTCTWHSRVTQCRSSMPGGMSDLQLPLFFNREDARIALHCCKSTQHLLA